MPHDGSVWEELLPRGSLAFFDFHTMRAVCEATISLRLLRLIVWPQEVSEVTEVKMKKKSESKILESPIFYFNRNMFIAV